GGAGADTIYGGSGDDALTGGAGADTLEGGAGADTVLAGGGLVPGSDTGFGEFTLIGGNAQYREESGGYALVDSSSEPRYQRVKFSVSSQPSEQNIVSLLVKAGTQDYVYLQSWGADGSYTVITYDLVGSEQPDVWTGAGSTDYGIVDLGDGWKQVWMERLTNTTSFWFGAAESLTDLEYTGTNEDALYFRDLQYENGVSEPTAPQIGGEAGDLLSYATSSEGIAVDLAAGTGAAGDAAGDVISGFMQVLGSAHDDTIDGSDADESLNGGLGDDSLDGGAGDDVLSAGSGSDVVVGGSGTDVVYVSHAYAAVVDQSVGASWLTLDFGNGDSVEIRNDVESIVFTDQTYGYEALRIAILNAENEPLIGTASSDTLYGSSLDDTISGLGGNDTIYGGAGSDELSGGDGVDRLFGEDGADSLYG
ncbi:MAG: hypothetical protein ABJ201_03915, partial [Nisaea sp.]